MTAMKELDANRVPLCGSPEDFSKSYGIARDVRLHGAVVLRAKESPCTYCSGAAFEVYMRALELVQRYQPGYAAGRLTRENFIDFRRKFYGTDGNRRTMVRALVEYRLAQEIGRIEDAQPGDLIQFWRHNGSGHSVVLLGLVHNDEGSVAGLRFWSSQSATSGFGISEEYFGTGGRSIIRADTFIARPLVTTAGG